MHVCEFLQYDDGIHCPCGRTPAQGLTTNSAGEATVAKNMDNPEQTQWQVDGQPVESVPAQPEAAAEVAPEVAAPEVQPEPVAEEAPAPAVEEPVAQPEPEPVQQPNGEVVAILAQMESMVNRLKELLAV